MALFMGSRARLEGFEEAIIQKKDVLVESLAVEGTERWQDHVAR